MPAVSLLEGGHRERNSATSGIRGRFGGGCWCAAGSLLSVWASNTITPSRQDPQSAEVPKCPLNKGPARFLPARVRAGPSRSPDRLSSGEPLLVARIIPIYSPPLAHPCIFVAVGIP